MPKVNKKAADKVRKMYHTDKKGVTHIGVQKKNETPWEARLRHVERTGGKDRYFKNEKEYTDWRKKNTPIIKRKGGSVSYGNSPSGGVRGYSKKYPGMGGDDE